MAKISSLEREGKENELPLANNLVTEFSRLPGAKGEWEAPWM